MTTMTVAKQLVYTTGNIRGKKGYQIVAKSRGIPNEVESELRPHFLPLGVRPEDLVESHSLVDLTGGSVAYCHARNVGAGYDGRRDTLCSHVTVFSRSDFAAIGYDTRALAPLHPGRRRMRGVLPSVDLRSLRAPPAPSPGEAGGLEPVFASALGLLLGGERVAVPSGDPTMSQKFLALLPPSVRPIQFSSATTIKTVSAGRHAHCRLVFYPPGMGPSPSSGFRVATAGSDAPGAGDVALGRAAHYYAKVALGGNMQRLGRIQRRFEGAPALSGRDRLVLACAYEQFVECGDESAKVEHAEDAFSAIKKLDPPAFSAYFGAIKDYVVPYREAANAFQSEPGRSPDLFSVWFDSFPLAIGLRMFSALVDSYSRGFGAVTNTTNCRDCDSDGDSTVPPDSAGTRTDRGAGA